MRGAGAPTKMLLGSRPAAEFGRLIGQLFFVQLAFDRQLRMKADQVSAVRSQLLPLLRHLQERSPLFFRAHPSCESTAGARVVAVLGGFAHSWAY